MAMAVITVERMFCRKMNTTRDTSTNASTRVDFCFFGIITCLYLFLFLWAEEGDLKKKPVPIRRIYGPVIRNESRQTVSPRKRIWVNINA